MWYAAPSTVSRPRSYAVGCSVLFLPLPMSQSCVVVGNCFFTGSFVTVVFSPSILRSDARRFSGSLSGKFTTESFLSVVCVVDLEERLLSTTRVWEVGHDPARGSGDVTKLPLQLFVGRGEHGHGDAPERRDAAPDLEELTLDGVSSQTGCWHCSTCSHFRTQAVYLLIKLRKLVSLLLRAAPSLIRRQDLAENSLDDLLESLREVISARSRRRELVRDIIEKLYFIGLVFQRSAQIDCASLAALEDGGFLSSVGEPCGSLTTGASDKLTSSWTAMGAKVLWSRPLKGTICCRLQRIVPGAANATRSVVLEG